MALLHDFSVRRKRRSRWLPTEWPIGNRDERLPADMGPAQRPIDELGWRRLQSKTPAPGPSATIILRRGHVYCTNYGRVPAYSAAMGALYGNDVDAAYYALSLLGSPEAPDHTSLMHEHEAMSCDMCREISYYGEWCTTSFIPAIALGSGEESNGGSEHYGEIAPAGAHATMRGQYRSPGMADRTLTASWHPSRPLRRAEARLPDEPRSYDFLMYAYRPTTRARSRC